VLTRVLGALILAAGGSLLAAPGALAQAGECAIEAADLITVTYDQNTSVRATTDLGPVPAGCGDLTLRIYVHRDADGDGVPDTAEPGDQKLVEGDGRPRSPVGLGCGTAALGFSVYLAPEAELADGSFSLDANPYLSSERVLDSYLSPGPDCEPPAPSSSGSTTTTTTTTTLPSTSGSTTTTTTGAPAGVVDATTTTEDEEPSTSTRLVAAVGELPPPPASGGGLPFTGTSAAVLAVAGLLLLIAGLTLLRAWRLLGIDRL
jgi:hypothetical protein